MGLSAMKKGLVLAPMVQGAKGMAFEARKTYVGNPAMMRVRFSDDRVASAASTPMRDPLPGNK